MPKPVVLQWLPKWILNPNIKMASVVVLYILASFFQTFVLSTISFPWRRTSMTMCFRWNGLLVRNFLVWIVMSFTMAAYLRAAREEKSWLMSTSLCWTPETIIARVTLNSWIHFWVQSAFCFTKSWPITFQALAIPSEIFLEAASPRSGCPHGRWGLSLDHRLLVMSSHGAKGHLIFLTCDIFSSLILCT